MTLSISVSFVASYYLAKSLQTEERRQSVEIFVHSIEPLLERFDVGDIHNVLAEVSSKNGLDHVRLVDPFGGYHELENGGEIEREPDLTLFPSSRNLDAQWRVEFWWGTDLGLRPLAMRISLFNTFVLTIAFILAWLSLRRTLFFHVVQPIQNLHREVSSTKFDQNEVKPNYIASIELNELRLSFQESLISLQRNAAAQATAIEREKLANAMIDRACRVAGIGIHFSFHRKDMPEMLGVTPPSILDHVWQLRFSPTHAIIDSIRTNTSNWQAIDGTPRRPDKDDATTRLKFAVEVDTHEGETWNIIGVEIGDDGFALISIDHTERKKLERIRFQSHKLEALGVVVSGVAHDVNNILATISGALELEGFRGNGGKNIEIARDSVDRGAVLVQQLLNISRQKEQISTVIDPADVFENLGKMTPMLLGPRHKLELFIRGAFSVYSNRDIFETTLINLLTNAKDAMSDGGTIKIVGRSAEKQELEAASLMATRTYVAFDVIDEGEGISPALMANIFDPFFTTKPTGKGTGLGLSLAYSFVSSVGGAISVKHRADKTGTIFTLYLPEASNFPELFIKKSAPSVQDTQTAKANNAYSDLNVLLVEDEQTLQGVVSSFLSLRGITHRCASSVSEAKSALDDSAAKYNFLLVDMYLTDGTGMEVLRHAAGLPQTFHTVLASGNFDVDGLVDHERSMIDAFLQKPYSLTSLDEICFKFASENGRLQ